MSEVQKWFCEGCGIEGSLELSSCASDVWSVIQAIVSQHNKMSECNETNKIRIINPNYVKEEN